MEERSPWSDDGRDLTGAAELITRALELLREGRALGCFQRAGLRLDALPFDYRGAVPGATSPGGPRPRSADLDLSTQALRKLAGRVVYRLRRYTED